MGSENKCLSIFYFDLFILMTEGVCWASRERERKREMDGDKWARRTEEEGSAEERENKKTRCQQICLSLHVVRRSFHSLPQRREKAREREGT